MKPVLWIDKKVFEGKWTTMALVSTVEPPNEDAVALYEPTKPLSDEEITFIWHKSMALAISDENLKNNISHASIFARAIEERHGIK